MDWISGIIVGVLALIGTLAGSWASIKRHSSLIDYRLKQIEEKQDKHNQIIERVYNLERRDAVHDEQIKIANKRIAALEGKKGA